MLWEVEIQSKNGPDREAQRIAAAFALSGNGSADVQVRSARGFLLEGNLERQQAQRLVDELLVDPVVETATLAELGGGTGVTVLLKPGVMDPVADSVLATARDLGVP